MHKQTATTAIIEDLNNHGFKARLNLNGNCLVSLNRPIFSMEVQIALMQSGYDDCQYSLTRAHGQVVVAAVTA
jgi:hypothetical protein